MSWELFQGLSGFFLTRQIKSLDCLMQELKENRIENRIENVIQAKDFFA